VTDLLGPVGDGHTPIPDEMVAALIPTYVSTLPELFAAEEENIAQGTYGRTPTAAELLDDLYLRGLHKAMFADVWTWAGTYRQHNLNVVLTDWHAITGLVKQLVEDAAAWVERETYPPDELAVRFHHRLVLIHPFVNGNGRHGRISADLLVSALGEPKFTWGAELDLDRPALRAEYRIALQRMDDDHDDVDDLLTFARS
jgi:Fic-DOC domain mobile mystery protein B